MNFFNFTSKRMNYSFTYSSHLKTMKYLGYYGFFSLKKKTQKKCQRSKESWTWRTTQKLFSPFLSCLIHPRLGAVRGKNRESLIELWWLIIFNLKANRHLDRQWSTICWFTPQKPTELGQAETRGLEANPGSKA